MSADSGAGFDLVCAGIATLDAIALVDRLPAPGERREAIEIRLAGGGVAATAAVAAARLGLRVAFVGRVADDLAGRLARDGLAGEGVDVGALATVEGRSPVSLVLVEASTGERSLVPDVSGVPPLRLAAPAARLAASAAWIHVDQTGHPLVAELRAAGVRTPVSFDGGNTSRHYALADVDLYAPTERALLARYPGAALDDALAAALAEGPSMVVATRGAGGAVAAVRDGEAAVTRFAAAAAEGIEITSTLGAGDVFHGALLAALIEGRPMADALRRANLAAALACRALDGRTAIPTTGELEAALASQEVTRART